MEKESLIAGSSIGIYKSSAEIFEAIADPSKMSEYFIARSTGRLEEGKSVMWKFPEFDIEFPVRGGKISYPDFISFYWDNDGRELVVEIRLKDSPLGYTVVSIDEKSMDNDEAGLKWLKNNTAGWANFLACLKAYLEFGINLRKGSFDFMKEEAHSGS